MTNVVIALARLALLGVSVYNIYCFWWREEC